MASIPHWSGIAAQGDNDAVTYIGLAAGAYAQTQGTESNAQIKYASPGTFSQLAVLCFANFRNAEIRYRFRINGVDGTQVVPIPAGQTGLFQDSTHTDTIAAGDLVSVQLELDAGAGDVGITAVGAVFTATTNTVTRLATYDGGNLVVGARYVALVGQSSYQAIEATRQYQVPTSGTLKNAGLNAGSNTRDGATTFTLRVNGSATAIVVTIPAGTTGWFEDTTHSQAVVAGDKCSWVTALGGTTGNCACAFVCVDLETTNETGAWGSASLANQDPALTRYVFLNGNNSSHDATESDVAVRALAVGRLSYLNVYVASNTINGPTTVRTRVSGANGQQSVTIPAATSGWFQDTVNIDNVLATDTVDAQIVTTGSSGTMLFQTIGALWGLPVAPLPIPLPLEPQAPCTQTAPVGGGGTGNAGCNVGGVGWVSSYTGPYGTVPEHADPTAGETMTGKGTLDLWIALYHVEYPSGTVTTHRRALVDLADDPSYHGGLKAGSLVNVGTIEHGLGNEQGTLEAGTVDIQFSDAISRWLRTLAEDQDLEGDEFEVYMASPTARAAMTAPRILLRAIVGKLSFDMPLRASIKALDALFSTFGPVGNRRTWPFYKFSDVFSEISGCPADVRERVIPVLYGEKSDVGARDPITNAPAAKGLLPCHFVGMFTDVTGATVANTSGPVVLPYDGGDITTITDVGCQDTAGSIPGGQLSTIVLGVRNGLQGSISNPAGTNHSTAHGIIVGWDALADPTIDSYRIYLFPGPWNWDPAVPTVNIPAWIRVMEHDTSTFDGGSFRDHIVTFSSLSSGIDGLQTVQTTTNDAWGFLVAGLMPWFRTIAAYGSDLGNGSATKKHDRVELDINGRSDILVPGSPGWPLATTYVPFTNADGKVFWLYGIYVKGPLLDDHRNGVVNITLNAIGNEDIGDGSGLPIIDAHAVQQHWIENSLLSDITGSLWVTNATAPKWPDGTYKVRSTRFALRQAFTATHLGGRGLTVGWYADTGRSLDNWFGEWDDSTDAQAGINGNGSVTLGWLDVTVDPTAWPLVDHEIDIFGPVRSTHKEQRENVISGSCDWDPDVRKFRIGPITRTSSAGLQKYKGHRAQRDQPLNSSILNVEAQLAWVHSLRLARLQFGVVPVEITGKVDLLDIDVDGPGIRLTTIEGTGAAGYVERPMQLLRRSFFVNRRTVQFALIDVQSALLETLYANGLDRLFPLTDTENAQTPDISDDEDVAPLILL